MGMKAVSGMFMDWSGIVSILFRPFLGTSPWVSRAENGPTRDSCLARLTHRLALAGIRSKKKKFSFIAKIFFDLPGGLLKSRELYRTIRFSYPTNRPE